MAKVFRLSKCLCFFVTRSLIKICGLALPQKADTSASRLILQFSHPNPHKYRNYTTANLRYLTVEQSLADVAHFVKYIKSTYVTPGTENSHVIVIGQHYSGSLAVWFRQKYPHLTIGAWASSAPLLAKVDHKEYKEVAGAVYRKFGGDSCYNRIENGFKEMEKMVADNQLDELSGLFALCTPLRTENDRRLFFSLIAEMFSYMTQIEDDE